MWKSRIKGSPEGWPIKVCFKKRLKREDRLSHSNLLWKVVQKFEGPLGKCSVTFVLFYFFFMHFGLIAVRKNTFC